jgi:hypothetical protein
VGWEEKRGYHEGNMNKVENKKMRRKITQKQKMGNENGMTRTRRKFKKR